MTREELERRKQAVARLGAAVGEAAYVFSTDEDGPDAGTRTGPDILMALDGVVRKTLAMATGIQALDYEVTQVPLDLEEWLQRTLDERQARAVRTLQEAHAVHVQRGSGPEPESEQEVQTVIVPIFHIFPVDA